MFSPRLKISSYAGLVAAVFGLASYRFYEHSGPGAAPGKEQVLVGTIVQGLSQAHYQPERIDDAFSKRVFDLALKRLDYRKKFLLQADIAQLMKYQTDIDDETKRGTHEFLDLSTKLMAERTKQMQVLTHAILAQPLRSTATRLFRRTSRRLPSLPTPPTSVSSGVSCSNTKPWCGWLR